MNIRESLSHGKEVNMNKVDKIFFMVLAGLAIALMVTLLSDKAFIGVLMFLVVMGLGEAIDKED